ncbi:MAG: N-acetylmuramoyl-L-alanine amidase [Candidatus Competibacteraceae bacterium]|nr:N-acetylmuramoyl-L-alanine amidase [Candidatus Competibacteraceae bacterium]
MKEICDLIDERLRRFGLIGGLRISSSSSPKPNHLYRHLQEEWLDTAEPRRIILHWTGGSYVASSLDKKHYHFLVQGAGQPEIIIGKYSVSANSDTSDGVYAAHVRGWNTDSIGIAICAMAGAKENGPYGIFPVTEQQFAVAVELCAELCHYYKINPENIMSHFEVERRGGPKQAGKWDVSVVPSMPLKGLALMESFRSRVRTHLLSLS